MSKPQYQIIYMGFYIRKKAEDKEEVYFIHEGQEIVCMDLTEAKREIEAIMKKKELSPQVPAPTHKSLPTSIFIKNKQSPQL